MSDQTTETPKTETGEEQTVSTQPPTNEPPQEKPPTLEELIAERDKWKSMSRKNEDDKKAALKELDDIRQANMTDAEKQLDEAKKSARKATLTEVGTRLVQAELKAAAAKAGAEIPEGFEKYMNVSSLMNDDGEPNPEAITELVSSFKPANPGSGFAQNIGLGPQGTGDGAPIDYSPQAIADRVRKRMPY